MSDNLTKGEYLGRLMFKYKLTQQQVAGETVNRVRILRITKNQAEISEEIAILIAENIKKILGEKLQEDPNYLYLYFYDNEKYIAAVNSQSYLNKLFIYQENNQYNEFFNTLDELENIFMENNIPELKVTAYELAATMCIINHEYSKAYSYALRAIDNVNILYDFDRKIKLFNIVAVTLFYSNKFNDLIDLCDNLLDKYEKNLRPEQVMKILFNSGLAYKETGKFDLAINCLNKLYDLVPNNDTDKLADILNSIAQCHYLQENYDEAIKISYETLELLGNKNIEKQIISYDTLLEIYTAKEDFIEIEKTINKLVSLIPKLNNNLKNSSHHPSVLFSKIAGAYLKLKNYGFSEFYYNKAIDAAKERNDSELQYMCISKLFEIMNSTHKNESIDLVLHNLYNVLTKYPNSTNNGIIFKILDYLANSGQIDKLTNILKLIIPKEEIR